MNFVPLFDCDRLATMHQSSETDVSTQGSPETSTAATTTSASPPDEASSPPLRHSQHIRAPPDRYRFKQ